MINSNLSLSRPPLILGAIAIVISLLTRIVLTLFTGFEAVPPVLWPGIFLRGLWFDMVVASFLIAPALLYEAIWPNRRRGGRVDRSVRIIWLWLAVASLLFGAVAEFTFWLEFSTRFNFIAIDYLIYTDEVIGNIRESYPVPIILAAIALAAAAVAWPLRYAAIAHGKLSARRRMTFALLAIALPAALVSFASVEQMEGQHNAYASELSGNGLFTLAAAMRRNELDYGRFYRTIDQHVADATLRTLGVERKPLLQVLESARGDPATDVIPFRRRPRNVILISVESLSASFVGVYGSKQNLTPNLDALARDGMQFDRVFATGTRTVRGLEALSLGTPPVPGQAIVRRPGNEHLATLGELLEHQGFATYFFYGGYGYFDNMNACFSANDYRVVDRTDIAKEKISFANVWGVADEVLFDQVLRTLDHPQAPQKPFLAHIMTTSNHRPFTYPDGRIDIASPGGREGAVKYTDYAIGKFIRDARAKPWFAGTLFVIVADHCAAVAGKTKLPVENYRIPLIFYAPQIVRPARYTNIMSQIDLAPTLIEVLGKEGDDHFFGRSVFEPGPSPQRALISNYQELGYLRDNILTVLLPKRRIESYRIDPETLASTPTEIDPRLMTEAIAYYQTAARAFKSGALLAPYYRK